MDNSNTESKNILMELESLKSKQCIFKMKEANYIKDKEILEDSIKTLQQDLQEKSEIIRSLRKDLDGQSSNLFRDIASKNEELDKSVLDINDLNKKLTIALETIDHHVKRNESMKAEFEKQKKSYDRESECKSRLITFLETSNLQKESKISTLTSDLNSLRSTLESIEVKFEEQKSLNNDLQKNFNEIKLSFNEERQKKDQELQRAKHEILQLQQNGISELHLEKMNPTVAATIKALKMSKGLMDIYSELHGAIGERDFLQLEKARLLRRNAELEEDLKLKETEIERLANESTESLKLIDTLKSRLLSLVSELRASDTKRGKMDREVLLAKRKLEVSEKEVLRLMEQVRQIIVGADNGDSIKQEAVDVDNAMYFSVQELQEVNRALRNDNDALRQRLEESDSEQFKQRCNELQSYSDNLGIEIDQLRHENTTNKNLLLIHEKQVKMLRYLLELKNPGSASLIENALRSLEYGVKGNIDVVPGDCELTKERSMDCEPEINEDSDRIAKLENELLELIDNKRASDKIYIESMERMRSDFISKNREVLELMGNLEDLQEKFKEERECNERYRKESELLRSINKNLSNTSDILEKQTEEFKIKLESKVTQLAEKKAELENCKTQLLSCRSQYVRLRHEREEWKKTLDKQGEILSNINSLQNINSLKDHLSLSHMHQKVQELDATVGNLKMELNTKNEEIQLITNELNVSRAELTESVSQLNESKALADAFNESISVPEQRDADCQVELLTVTEFKNNETEMSVDYEQVTEAAVAEYKKTVDSLELQLQEMKASQQSLVDKIAVEELKIIEMNQKCEFYESQLNIMEKSKQDVLNENIKLTEEAHDLNASLKHDLHRHQEELSKMKLRLDEAETVERTAQSVIDKYVKECNEAKAKYKRELTLHASDSKLLEALNREIEILKSKEDDGDERCKQLRSELVACEGNWQSVVADLRAQVTHVEGQLREAESRNDRLYEQLTQRPGNESNALLNEVIEDLRGQIKLGKLSGNLLSVEKDKYNNELEILSSEIRDLQDQLLMEKDKSNASISESDLSSRNIESEIVMESNQVLREQKAQLDRLVLSQRTEIDDLGHTVTRLRTDLAELETQTSGLVTVKAELEEERNRWKDRCTKLIERAEQLDPEKYRVACNDRDRFEKQLSERENNFRDVQSELRNAKEEIKQLLLAIEDEKNKIKKEEAIGLRLKEIARKYKSESEKSRQTIVELEESQLELGKEKEILLKEKEDAIRQLNVTEAEFNSSTKAFNEEKEKIMAKLETAELDLESTTKLLADEKQEKTVRLEKAENEFVDRMEILVQEKQTALFRLAALESELESCKKTMEEVNFRCQLLEETDKEKSKKIQLLQRLNEENKKLKMGQIEDKVVLKRGITDDYVDEPELKRMKETVDNAEEASDDEDEDEEVDEEEDESVTFDEHEASAMESNLISSINANNTPQIWWNVCSTGDDQQKGQAPQYQATEISNVLVDAEMENELRDASSEDESTEECVNTKGLIEGNESIGNTYGQDCQDENQRFEEENSEFDNQSEQERTTDTMSERNDYIQERDSVSAHYRHNNEEEVSECDEETHEVYNDVHGGYQGGQDGYSIVHEESHEEYEEEGHDNVSDLEGVQHCEEEEHGEFDEEVHNEEEDYDDNANDQYTEERNEYYIDQGRTMGGFQSFENARELYQELDDGNDNEVGEDASSEGQYYHEQEHRQTNFSAYMLNRPQIKDEEEEDEEENDSGSSVMIIEDSSDEESEQRTSVVSDQNVSKEMEEQDDGQSETMSTSNTNEQTESMTNTEVSGQMLSPSKLFEQFHGPVAETTVASDQRRDSTGPVTRGGRLRKLNRRGGL